MTTARKFFSIDSLFHGFNAVALTGLVLASFAALI
jgi:hypothetical protein